MITLQSYISYTCIFFNLFLIISFYNEKTCIKYSLYFTSQNFSPVGAFSPALLSKDNQSFISFTSIIIDTTSTYWLKFHMHNKYRCMFQCHITKWCAWLCMLIIRTKRIKPDIHNNTVLTVCSNVTRNFGFSLSWDGNNIYSTGTCHYDIRLWSVPVTLKLLQSKTIPLISWPIELNKHFYKEQTQSIVHIILVYIISAL